MIHEIHTYYGGSKESETKLNVIDTPKINNLIDLWKKKMSSIESEENKNDELKKYFNLSLAASSVDVWWEIRETEFPIIKL